MLDGSAVEYWNMGSMADTPAETLHDGLVYPQPSFRPVVHHAHEHIQSQVIPPLAVQLHGFDKFW